MAVRTERYELGRELARGGMATVHLGRRLGAAGFERPVAVKRMHPHLLVDPEFVEMFVEEARLASHIHHPNVAQTLDVVLEDGELWLVLELVRGTSVSRLLTAAGRVPTDIACSIAHGALLGLDAAHDACDAAGRPLEIVHRDVSPQNVMVGVDGTARIIDFGVAKAAARSAVTRDGMIKGKIAYMAPEQLTSSPVDRRTDVFAMGIVLWELLRGERLFVAASHDVVGFQVLTKSIEAPCEDPELARVVLKALEREPEQRFATARQFALALEQSAPLASRIRVGAWVEGAGLDELDLFDRSTSSPVHESGSAATVLTEPPGLGETRSAFVTGAALSNPTPAASDAPRAMRPRAAKAAVALVATVAVLAGAWQLGPSSRVLALQEIRLASVGRPPPSGDASNQEVPPPSSRAVASPGAAVSAAATQTTTPAAPGTHAAAPSSSAPTLRGSSPWPTPRASPPSRRPPPSKPADCDVKYFIKNGRKHFKRHCF